MPVRRQLLVLGTTLAVLSIAACASQEPRAPVVLRSPSEAIPSYIREVMEGKTVALSVPREMRGVAIDFLRAAGATVIEGRSPELYLEGSSRSQVLAPTIRVVTVDLELKAPRADRSKVIIFRGRGQAPSERVRSESPVAIAGARALANLH